MLFENKDSVLTLCASSAEEEQREIFFGLTFWLKVLGVEILRPRYLEATSLRGGYCWGSGSESVKGLEVAKEFLEIEDHFSPRAETVETYNRFVPHI